jgi:hypothetical protein
MQINSSPSTLIILSGIQLSTNPRVVKEADALAEAGYNVEVVCASVQLELRERDRLLFEGKHWKYTALLDGGSPKWSDKAFSLWARGRFRLWRELLRWARIQNHRQAGLIVPEMLRHCLRNPADLYIVHNPDSLWVGAQLLGRGRTVAADIEDWYSEDLLPDDRRKYPVEDLQKWENYVLQKAVYASTTSNAMSKALADAYDCPRPVVIYNSFSWKERELLDGKIRDRNDISIPSLCWFSQVIGPGRGLETLMDSLHHTSSRFEVHLRGTCVMAYRDELLARAPENWRRRIYFHDQVGQSELLSRVAEHDVGLAAEIPFCRNKALTVSNKLPLYLLAGLAVVASDTEGQKEIASLATKAMVTFRAGDPTTLASSLDLLMGDSSKLAAAKQSALSAAERFFCWERSEPVLIAAVARALAHRNGAAARAPVE